MISLLQNFSFLIIYYIMMNYYNRHYVYTCVRECVNEEKIKFFFLCNAFCCCVTVSGTGVSSRRSYITSIDNCLSPSENRNESVKETRGIV